MLRLIRLAYLCVWFVGNNSMRLAAADTNGIGTQAVLRLIRSAYLCVWFVGKNSMHGAAADTNARGT